MSLLASAALAQTSGTLTGKDATGATFPLAVQTDASGAKHYRDVVEGLTPAGVPVAAYVDANGLMHVSVDAAALPAGAAKDASVTQLDTALKAAFAAGMAVTVSGGPTLANQQLSVTAEQTMATNSAYASTSANQLGTANFAPAQVSVAATATPLVTARAARRSVTIYNTGTAAIYLGGSGVTATSGFPIPSGGTLTVAFAGALYAITASGTGAASLYEVF